MLWSQSFQRTLHEARASLSFDWFIGLFTSVYSFDYCLSVKSGSDTAKSLSVPFFTVQIYPIKAREEEGLPWQEQSF